MVVGFFRVVVCGGGFILVVYGIFQVVMGDGVYFPGRGGW